LDRVLKASIKRELSADQRDDGPQSVWPENTGRATAPMKPRNPRLPLHEAGSELNLGLQRAPIGVNDVVSNGHLGVAAAVKADLGAIGYVKIDRDTLASIEFAEPRCMLLRGDLRREVGGGRI